MKNNKFKVFITIALSLCTVLCYAQGNVKWSSLMSNPQADFYDIVAQVDSAFHVVQPDTGEGEEVMTFMRWKSFWERRMGSAIFQQKNGSFLPALKTIYSLTQTEICTGSSAFNNNWTLIGPKSVPINQLVELMQLPEIPIQETIQSFMLVHQLLVYGEQQISLPQLPNGRTLQIVNVFQD
jgi:hypothetical protein